jgi:hypothetical protein
MKLGWSLAAIGTSLALGIGSASAGEPNWLAPVVRVEGDGAAAAPSAAASGAPAVAMPTGQGVGQDCNGGCNQGCNTCGGCCEIFNPPMIGNDLPANTYNGQFLRNNPFAYALVPQVQRGAFKISDNESPRPEDRVFAYYTYFNRVSFPGFEVVPTPFGAATVGRAFNTDVHRETFGFEKTFLGGDASIGVRMNVIQQDGDVQDDDFGDTTIIGKYTLINRENLLVSIGLAVTAPTGTANAGGAGGGTYRSVLFQPYSGFIWNRERFYVQGFNAFIVSTDDRDPRFATYDLGAGYRLYQSECCKDHWLSYVIPTAEVHANLPTTKEGFANRLDTALPDSLITTVGVHIGLGCKANLAIGAGLPLSGPKLYDVSGMAQLNWRF